MSFTHLALPDRSVKPRTGGFTMAIDNGVPFNYFCDLIGSAAEHVDFVKFGWGTSVVTSNLDKKISFLKSEGVDFYLGGTLFEKYVIQDRFRQYFELLRDYECTYVEVSNGTIDLEDARKSEYVAALSDEFKVISEVGSKDNVRSENMAPNRWIEYIRDDLAAGAVLVTLETRESGHGGICRPNGELRYGLLEEILTSGIDPNVLLFEAPSMELQSYFVRRIGTDVNLGNIAPTDLIGVETIRLGLRSETLLQFEPVGATAQREKL
jgi:phosphosulfolactate synthase